MLNFTSFRSKFITFYYIINGTIKCHKIIPKLIFYLSHNYPKRNTTIIVPNIIMAAEKLTVMDKKYGKDLNNKFKFWQSYL